jgi:Flp pilus assembly protein TadD
VALQKALLTNDKPGRMAALRALNAASPADLNLLRTLAENELAAGDFVAASTHWKQLRDALPNDQNAWNQLGYALAWSGNYSAAVQALKDYAARWPTNPNPLDSEADVDFLYGKFAEAAAKYLKANEKDPQFLAGGELYKAAWAQFRAGDKAKADATFAQFKAVRTKTETSGFALTEADWLYRTGRTDQATALLRKEASTAQPAVASQFYSQLVIWDLLAKDRTAAQKDAAIEATKPPSNVSTVARFAALTSASPEEWRKRADTLLHGSGADAARRFALGAALILDGKKDAAISVWDEIVKEDSSTDFYARTIAARLKGQKPPFELLPDATSVNQLRALPDSL